MAGVDRGVSTVVGYVLNLGIATVLVVGLLLAGGGLVEDQRERTVRAELDVVGNRMAADLEAADRLLLAGNSSITVRSSQPDRVVGLDYDVAVQASDGNVSLRLSTRDPAVERTVKLTNRSEIQPGTVSGGDLTIQGSGNTLEVTNG